MTKAFHPLTTTDCDQICEQAEELGQGITYSSMRRAYDYAVHRCVFWLNTEGRDWLKDVEDAPAMALEMRTAVLREPQSLKQRMLCAIKNDEDNERLLQLINSMEDN